MALLIPIGVVCVWLFIIWVDSRSHQGSDLLGDGCASAIGIALMFPAYGAYSWLRYGTYKDIKVIDVLHLFRLEETFSTSVGWVGFQKLNLAYLNSSVFFSVVVVTGAVVMIGMRIDEADERRRDREREAAFNKARDDDRAKRDKEKSERS